MIPLNCFFNFQNGSDNGLEVVLNIPESQSLECFNQTIKDNGNKLKGLAEGVERACGDLYSFKNELLSEVWHVRSEVEAAYAHHLSLPAEYCRSEAFLNPSNDERLSDIECLLTLKHEPHLEHGKGLNFEVLSRFPGKKRAKFITALIRQKKDSVNHIRLSDKDIADLQGWLYSLIHPEYVGQIDEFKQVLEIFSENTQELHDGMANILNQAIGLDFLINGDESIKNERKCEVA